jgi:predicted transcriptional regulator
MRRVTILLKDEEKAALDELAQRSYRDPRDVLRLLLREAAQQRGLLPPIAVEDRPFVYALGETAAQQDAPRQEAYAAAAS